MIEHINLCGEWDLRWDDGQRGDRLGRLNTPDADMSRAIPARVPGEVHADLVRAGLIAEPTLGLADLAARWVQDTVWHYRRVFSAPRPPAGARAFLTFEGLDLAAAVYLNGIEAGRHANAFYPCVLDVTDTLRVGDNVLVVRVESGLHHAADRPGTGYGMQIDSQRAKRNWLRKVQSSFGWDWAPQLLNVGITGGVRLEFCRSARVESLALPVDLSADLRRGSVTARVSAHGVGAAARAGALEIEIGEMDRRISVPVRIDPGPNTLVARLVVENPEPWWPIGHGDRRLYTVRTTLTVDGENVLDATRRVGFRHVRVNQDPHPVEGTRFVFEINGKPIFAKGGNFVPADPLYTRIDRARYTTLVDRALEANFNLLRVWGGGLYEADAFYELCDEHGILVWQEFIFACAKYPAFDEAYLADIKREASWQVRRLAHHPSLVAWCGNNEMEEGNHNWGYERGVAHPDYAIFHHVLPLIVRREDGTRYYQPSSPYSPDHQDPRAWHTGDQHPWTVGFKNTDFRDYRAMSCRFPNEGGILGPAALPTVMACLPPGHRTPGSVAWEMRDNAVSYWEGGSRPFPDLMLEQWLGRSLAGMSLEDYVYWAGLVQGEGLGEYIRNFRRRMFDTASAIFWMYNDCWPMVRSWTIVDYYLRRTPSFHPVRRAFQPLAVFLSVEGGKVGVWGVNEEEAWRGSLRYGLVRLSGSYPVDRRREVTLPANGSTLLAELDLETWKSLGEKTHAAFALLERNGGEVARDRLFLPFFREMDWPRAAVTARTEGEHAVFESDVFAWRVCLDLDGEKDLPDNFFDLLPGVPTRLPWTPRLGEPRVLRLGNG